VAIPTSWLSMRAGILTTLTTSALDRRSLQWFETSLRDLVRRLVEPH
jgi:hypothetical protein